jgi:hypothetical protein
MFLFEQQVAQVIDLTVLLELGVFRFESSIFGFIPREWG